MPWMPIDPAVKQLLVPDLRALHLPEADVVVATFFRTAPYVFDLPASRGSKFYLIQHYETWAGPKEEVDATWMLPMHRIVISQWLAEIAEALKTPGSTTYIPNGLDLDGLYVEEPAGIASRTKSVAMLYHKQQMKGSAEGIAALVRVKQQVPELSASLFGTSERGPEIPDWVTYTQLPSRDALRHIYNSAALFLQPSQSEGWGLTSTEAMACGCALITTDNGGSQDFARHGDTALVCAVGDVDAMAAHILQLLDAPELLHRIAASGEQCARQFTWERAVDSIERAFSTSQTE